MTIRSSGFFQYGQDNRLKEIIVRKSKTAGFHLFSRRFVDAKTEKERIQLILIVGDVVLPELGTYQKERSQGKEINYTVMSREELDFRKKRLSISLEILSGSRNDNR
jgi:hypothetical protein